MTITRWFLIALLFASAAGTGRAEVSPFDVQGFRFDLSVTVPGDTVTTFDALTGDISPWWDHTFSGDPAELRIDPFPGGVFHEGFKTGDDGVRHAVVTWAERGKGIRMEGPLGLAGRSFFMVSTLTLSPAEGDSTTVRADIAMMGEVDDELAGIVESVWTHFLVGRFKPYREGTLTE